MINKMRERKLFNEILKSVSRSFYLSLRILPERMRETVSLAYLLCRTADSIADTTIIPWQDRLKTLRRFRDLFNKFPIPADALNEFISDLAYANTVPQTREGRLLSRFGDCVNLFNQASKTDQALIQEVVLAVIKGMEIDLTTFGDSEQTLRALPTMDDLEEYIQQIGGEPGRFWSKVILEYFPQLAIGDRENWIEKGIKFGQGLQMVNILRDLAGDLKEGRSYLPYELLKKRGLTPEDLLVEETTDFFLPIYHQMIDEAVGRMEHGLSYIRQIPARFWKLRLSVWWPLAIGLKTLGQLRANANVLNQDSGPVKISRLNVYFLLLNSLWQIPFDFLLKKEFQKYSGN